MINEHERYRSLPHVGFANSFAGIGVVIGGTLGALAAMTEASMAGLAVHAAEWGECFLAGGFLGCSIGAIVGGVLDYKHVKPHESSERLTRH